MVRRHRQPPQSQQQRVAATTTTAPTPTPTHMRDALLSWQGDTTYMMLVVANGYFPVGLGDRAHCSAGLTLYFAHS